jgi:hypothetical protein
MGKSAGEFFIETKDADLDVTDLVNSVEVRTQLFGTKALHITRRCLRKLDCGEALSELEKLFMFALSEVIQEHIRNNGNEPSEVGE